MAQDISSRKHRSPAVQRLVDDLTLQIRTGALRPGDYLSSAHTLAREYGIGYVSVIRAYKTLSDLGLVETVQGRGAFVRGAQATAMREIAVVLPSQGMMSRAVNPHSDWVYHELLAGMSTAILAHGLRLQLHFADVLGARWPAVVEEMKAGGGIVFVLLAPSPWVLRLQRQGIPYALIMPVTLGEWERELPCAYADYHGSVRDAVGALVATGRRRAAFLGDPANAHEGARYAGYAAAISTHGGEEVLVLTCVEISREAGRAAMAAYLAGHPVPDFNLLVAGNDLRALGALDALAAHGMRVPEEMAVLGFDDIPAAVEASLSSVRLPIRELGEQGIHWFLNHVVNHAGVDVPQLSLPCPAIWRSSTSG